MEEWKQYRDTNYEVSNLGNIRSKETKNTGIMLRRIDIYKDIIYNIYTFKRN